MKDKEKKWEDWGEPSDWDGSLTPVKERGGKIEVEWGLQFWESFSQDRGVSSSQSPVSQKWA